MNQQFGMSLGIVKNNADPAQEGRLQVFVPAWDPEDFKTKDLPWCLYVTPMGGTTVDILTGREEKKVDGITSYGMWAIPKNGAQVLVGCLDGNPGFRFWSGCVFMPEHNRTMPAGIEGVTSEIDDSNIYGQHDFEHIRENLADAGLDKDDPHFRTRGGYARSVAHPSNKTTDKPTENGYADNLNEPAKAESQTWSFTTPGRHFIEMSDVKDNARIRVKTSEGNQIILDDTNERIYISTAKGRNWIELDETNGKVYVYSDSKINISSRNDINLYSEENINIVANKRLNLKSEERAVVVQAKQDVRLLSTAADVMLTASRDISLATTNGPSASAVGSSSKVDAPQWHSKPGGKGVVWSWSEKGGSGTSSIRFDAAQNIHGLAQGSINLTSTAKISFRSAGPVAIGGSTFSGVFGSMKWNVGSTGLIANTTPVTALGGATPPDSASGAKTIDAEQITDHMIIPKHESWVRDADEALSPTPRGPNYEG
jgi:hypothetical protein